MHTPTTLSASVAGPEHSRTLSARTHNIQTMSGRSKPGATDCPFEHRLDAALATRGHHEIIHATAAHANQMVVMAHQILGQFITGPIIAADHLLYDTNLLEHSKVAIHRALGQFGTHLEEIRNGRRAADCCQQTNQLASTRRVELVRSTQKGPRRLMNTSQIHL